MAKLMPLEEFVETGYLQEVNRQFLHPLGLALAVSTDTDTGQTSLLGLYDSRDGPEGFAFADDVVVDPAFYEKGNRIAEIYAERRVPRLDRLGYVIQPLPTPPRKRSIDDGVA